VGAVQIGNQESQIENQEWSHVTLIYDLTNRPESFKGLLLTDDKIKLSIGLRGGGMRVVLGNWEWAIPLQLYFL